MSSVNQPHTGLAVRILFDSGSQWSYITKRARNKLSLSTMRTEKLLIKTFGCENEQLKECDAVQFYVKGLGVDSSTVQMTAHVVPLICSSLKDQAVQLAQESYKHLVDLELADCPTMGCSSEVDILIGNDIYWCFFTGDLKRGEFGPVAVKTTFGLVLSGPLPQELSSEPEVNLTTCHTLRLDTSNPCSIIADEKNRDPLVEIQDLLISKKASLNSSPFMRFKDQLDPDEEDETRQIASVHIHVERAIERIKNFNIL